MVKDKEDCYELQTWNLKNLGLNLQDAQTVRCELATVKRFGS